MAHTTYPTTQFRTVHSFAPSLSQPSAHIQSSTSTLLQLSGTPQSVSPAHRRYSSFPHLSPPFTDLAADRTATEQPASNDHPASYQQLNFFEGQHGCATKVEDSPSIHSMLHVKSALCQSRAMQTVRAILNAPHVCKNAPLSNRPRRFMGPVTPTPKLHHPLYQNGGSGRRVVER